MAQVLDHSVSHRARADLHSSVLSLAYKFESSNAYMCLYTYMFLKMSHTCV